MPFNLYFAGSNNPGWEKYLLEHDCNRLASQLLDKRVISDWTEAKNQGIAKGHLFIDSGAFSAHTKGAEVNIESYIEFLNGIDEYIEIFAQVDKIPGEFRQVKTKEQCLEAPKQSWENYLYMREQVKSPDKLLYIFHQNEDFKWLKECLDAKFDGRYIPYIGISPANDKSTKEKQAWFETVFQIIRDSKNADVKTHAFGMTSLKMLEMYPFYSADSTSWIMTGANGGIMTKYGVLIVSEKQTKDPNHICHVKDDGIFKYITDMGFDFETLKTDYVERIKFNAAYLKDWSDNYQFKGSNNYKKRLF